MVVNQIPAGCVATYGQVAALAGIPKNSRQVGSVLKNLQRGSGVPWFRVVNSQGQISSRADENSSCVQAMLLQDEGVEVSRHGRISLGRYGWKP